MRRPLHVIVTWNDAADRQETCSWDGTFETARRIPESVKPYLGREATGFLGYVDSEWLYLASDYDAPDGELGKWAVVPVGWITKVVMASGRVLYSRETPRAPRATARRRARE